MKIQLSLACAALALSASAALAQQTNPPHVDMPVSAVTGQIAPRVESLPTKPGATTPAAGNVAVTYPNVATPVGNGTPYLSDNVSGPTAQAKVVASEPVPDTPAARQMYRPLSRSGAKTAAVGN